MPQAIKKKKVILIYYGFPLNKEQFYFKVYDSEKPVCKNLKFRKKKTASGKTINKIFGPSKILA